MSDIWIIKELEKLYQASNLREEKESDELLNSTRNKQISIVKRSINKLKKDRRLLEYNLSEADLKVIAFIYGKENQELEFEVSSEEVLTSCEMMNSSLVGKKEFLTSLLDREILTLSGSGDIHYHFDIEELFENRYKINGYFHHCLMGSNVYHQAVASFETGLCDNRPLIRLSCEYLDSLFNHYPELIATIRTSKCNSFFGKRVNFFLDYLWEKVHSLPDGEYLVKLVKEKLISMFEFKVIVLTYYITVDRQEDLESNSLLRLLSVNPQDNKEKKTVFKNHTARNLGCFLQDRDRLFGFGKDIEFTEEFMNMLESSDTIKTKTLNDYMKQDDLLIEIDANQSIKRLILSKKEDEVLSSIINRLKKGSFLDWDRWGLFPNSLNATDKTAGEKGLPEKANSKHKEGYNLLFYGNPGTGKTLAASVLAKELGRHLVSVNMHNLRNCYYGTTEKRVKSLFHKMRQLVTEIEPTPLFLLNEADQLLHKRIEGKTSVDFTENGIQNIFLEELETFPGIVVATTNLIFNIDEAMSRRFHIKMEFSLPDEECRYRLWKLHLPETIPGVEEIDFHYLARTYSFSGGQIRLVANNGCYEAITRGNGSKLTIGDIIMFACIEAKGSFENSRKPIGF